MSIRGPYDQWSRYARRLTSAVAGLTDEQLGIRASPGHDPIWALAAHTAGTRVYWMCGVLGEPGAETTPWPAASGEGWEDDPDHPRSAGELVMALETSWAIIDGVLDRWTPEMLHETVERRSGTTVQVHSRASILQRMLTHDAFHSGEISQLLGVHGLPEIDLWRQAADPPA
jgi:uncharacterized damage-inducible protein DinB